MHVIALAGHLPDATGNCASFCLDRAASKSHRLPFLLCKECKCQNPEAEADGGACLSRNGSKCTTHCGGARFPICPFLHKNSVSGKVRKISSSSSMKSGGNRIHSVSVTRETYDQMYVRFIELFDNYIEHGLGDMHSKKAKEQLLRSVEQDRSLVAAFVDWSQILQLKQMRTSVGAKHVRLGVMVGIVVGSDEQNKLFGETVIGVSDHGDNSSRATIVYLINLLRKIKSERPWVTKVILFSDGGPKHFRTVLTFALLPHLARMFGLQLEWMFFKVCRSFFVCPPPPAPAPTPVASSLCACVRCCNSFNCQEYHGKYVYDPEGGLFKFHALEYIRHPLAGAPPLADASSLLEAMESRRGDEWKQPPPKKYSSTRYPILSRSALLLAQSDLELFEQNMSGLIFDSKHMVCRRSLVRSIKGSKGSTFRPYHVRTLSLDQTLKLSCEDTCGQPCGRPEHTLSASFVSSPCVSSGIACAFNGRAAGAGLPGMAPSST